MSKYKNFKNNVLKEKFYGYFYVKTVANPEKKDMLIEKLIELD